MAVDEPIPATSPAASPAVSPAARDASPSAVGGEADVGVPLVEMRGITKAYPGVLANDAVDLVLGRGRVHALLGENGAGKSTLVKILYGLLEPDAGELRWRGEPVRVTSPAAARRLGIAMVFQHFSLFESMTVLENIALGMALDADETLAARVREVSSRYGLPLDPERPVHTLSVGARQRIEICRCLLQEPALLVMDEPTSVLTPQEVGELFATLKRLAAEGTAILYISHKLDEIRRLCDEATILRGGRRVASADPAVESAASLAALMMGEEVGASADLLRREGGSAGSRADGPGVERVENGSPEIESPENEGSERENESTAPARAGEAAPDRSPRLLVEGVTLPAAERHASALHDISLAVHGGEIVGIAGVAGNGQDELMALLAGERRLPGSASTGSGGALIRLDGQDVAALDAGARRALGLCAVPEERLGHAAVPGMTLAENAFLTAHRRRPLRRGGLIAPGASRRFAAEIIERFDVRCDGPSSLAASLSGGNLQKFVVGREILQEPAVLVVSQPTWGVDAGAARAIHEALRALAARGSAVLVVSQDLDELMALSDRIGALCAGRLSAFHATASVGVREVGLLMGGESLAA